MISRSRNTTGSNKAEITEGEASQRGSRSAIFQPTNSVSIFRKEAFLQFVTSIKVVQTKLILIAKSHTFLKKIIPKYHRIKVYKL